MLLKANFPPVSASEEESRLHTGLIIHLLQTSSSETSSSSSSQTFHSFPKAPQLLWAEQYLECYQTSFFLQQEFPLLAALGGAAALNPLPRPGRGFDGCRAQGWVCWVEQLERMAGRDPLLYPGFTQILQHIPTLLSLSTTLTWCPEWSFCSDKFCRGR